MARATGLALGLAATAAVTLSATPARAAECSETAETIVNVSATAVSFIPKVGDIASAGIGLGAALFCDENEPLNVQDVLNIVRDELDAFTLATVEGNLEAASFAMETTAVQLENGEAPFVGSDADIAGAIFDRALSIKGDINLAEEPFSVQMRQVNNQRMSYDLSAALVLANYKLALVQLVTASSTSDSALLFADQVANEILADVPGYRLEADRLREMTAVKAGNGYILKRGGAQVFGQGGTRSGVENHRIIPFLEELDAQDAQLALVEARALALLDDPFVDLSTVPVPAPRAPIMLKSLSDANRCVQNVEGRFRHDGVLREGFTRQRDCVPTLSSQLWLLEDSGRIRSNHAPVCLTARDDSKGTVMVEECTGDEEGNGVSENQVWTRRGDTFEVVIDGVTTCLQNPRDFGKTLRHKSCLSNDSHQVQQWHVYAPLKSGRPAQLPDVDPTTLSTLPFEDVVAISEGFGAGSNLCASRGTFEMQLVECARYRRGVAPQLWAQDAQGLLQSLDADSPTLVLPVFDDVENPDGPLLVGALTSNPPAPGSGILFERNPEADGAVTLTREDDGNLLLPVPTGFNFEIHPTVIPAFFVVTGVEQPDENGDLPDDHFWQHFIGGKFAE